MALLERRRRIARRAEQLGERVAPQPAARRDAVLHLVVAPSPEVMAEVAQVEREGAVVLRAARSAASRRRSAARRRARGPSPCTRRRSAGSRGTASSPRRTRRANAGSRRGRRPRDVPPSPSAPGGRREIAEAVDRDGHGLVEGRDEEGRGEMARWCSTACTVPRNSWSGSALLEVARDVGALAALAQALEHVARARRPRSGRRRACASGWRDCRC